MQKSNQIQNVSNHEKNHQLMVIVSLEVLLHFEFYFFSHIWLIYQIILKIHLN